MTFNWIMLGVLGAALGLLFVFTLLKMSAHQDRAARHNQKLLDPYSDVTITRFGDG